MGISAHYASMLLKIDRMLQHSDVIDIDVMQNALIITRILTWEEAEYTYAQWDAQKSS